MTQPDKLTIEEAQRRVDGLTTCLLDVHDEDCEVRLKWERELTIYKQLATTMRELQVKQAALDFANATLDVVESSTKFALQRTQDLMRENEKLRSCLKAFYFDTMYKDSPGLHDIACELLAPYDEEFAEVQRSKHRGVVTVECEADKKYECFGAGGNSQSTKT